MSDQTANKTLENLKKEFIKKHPKTVQFMLEKGIKFEDLFSNFKLIVSALMLLNSNINLKSVNIKNLNDLSIDDLSNIEKALYSQDIFTSADEVKDLKIKEDKVLDQDVYDNMQKQLSAKQKSEYLDRLSKIVLETKGHLDREQEQEMETVLSDILGFSVKAELEGHRLNHSFGIMGREQHLYRYPNDSLYQHDAFIEAGIAPNRGAFGYFVQKDISVEQAILNEKYYFAVQTLYLPDWSSNYRSLKKWYRFRKMIMINPIERVAVVGVVGDAGPAKWTGKQFGGSPEVIAYGKVWSKKTKGHIILLFVDDKENKIPLGVYDLDKLINVK